MKRFMCFLFLYNILKLVECQACNETGFFGPSCEFKCHCSGACDNTGNCIRRSRECAIGWFGLRCQYYDVTINATVKAGTTVLEKTDSCYSGVNSNSLTFKWNDPVPFTWMRIQISPSKYRRNGFSTESLIVESLRHFTLKFKDNSSKTTQCRNQKVFQLNETTFDFYCNFNLPMKQLIVEGETVKSICQIKISGGRNLALKQKTYQTSTYVSDESFGPRLAVDGSVMATCAYHGCSHTNTNDTNPSWAVIFDKQYDIKRFILHNRVDDSGWRLRHFNLQALDSSNTTIFNYTDTDNEDKLNYTVLYLTGSLVSGVKVSQTNINNKTNQISAETDKVPYVSINEFEAFGDCKPGMWGLNCTDQCKSPCIDQCVRDDGSCNVFCVGYSDPPTCTIECDKGIWGLNCAKRCNSSCYKSFCNKKNGTCLNGCLGFSDPPQCTEPCTIGHFGKNCTKRCHSNCFNETCHPASGQCLSCYPGYQGDNCDKSNTIELGALDSLVGAVTGGLLLVILILAGIIIIRCRQKRINGKETTSVQDAKKTPSNAEDSGLKLIPRKEYLDNAEIFNEQNSKATEPYSNFVALNSRETSIAVCNLFSFMQSQTFDFFKQQFQSLPEPHGVTTDAAVQDGHRTKNRFKNICPYDHSRVHLIANTEKHESDYINASYIEGYTASVKFIASQGPNSVTVNDFFRMLWEQNTEKVVMLTNVIEDGKIKCEKYWADSDKIKYGEIEINHISMQTFADYTIRKVEMSKKGEASHQVTQFHFTAWPDKSVPTASWSLVDFEQRVFTTPTSRPVVVHCSAGVGRTGTFIALHNVMMQAEKEKKVDFYNTVLKLRQDRMLMVQTAEQYEFLHKAALAAIVCLGTTMSGNEFEERLRILEKKTFLSHSKIDTEFQDVCNVCKVNENSLKGMETTEKSENIYQNSSTTLVKDRFPDIIPSDPYRPHIVSSSTDDGGYINAIVLSGFRQNNQQIITQLPMPQTVTDFWSLVTQYNVSIMVAFEVDGMKSDKTFGSYLPLSTDCIMTSSPFQIKSGHRTDEKLWQEQQLIVSIEKISSLCVKAEDQEHHKLTHIQCKFTEFDCKKMLSFITEIRKKLSADGRILYMCRNGALYSGLACVLSLLLDRMDNDSCINIPLVVGTVKSIRPQVIPTVEQYRLLYKILQLYIQKPNDYSRNKFQPNDGALNSVRSNVGGTDIYANF